MNKENAKFFKIFVWKLNDMFNLQKSRQNATTASSLIIISLLIIQLRLFKWMDFYLLIYFNSKGILPVLLKPFILGAINASHWKKSFTIIQCITTYFPLVRYSLKNFNFQQQNILTNDTCIWYTCLHRNTTMILNFR